MREVILGIKDYLGDCWHDFICQNARKLGVELRRQDKPRDYTDDEYWKRWVYEPDIKEGSVWHYIRQRRIAKKVKEIAQQSER